MSRDKTEIQRQINNLQSSQENQQSHLTTLSSQLEHLRAAKKSLQTEMNTLSAMAKAAGSLGNNGSGPFNGTRRTDFNSKLQTVHSVINSEIGKHKENVSLIDVKITVLEGQQGNIQGVIDQLGTDIQDLITLL